MLWLTRLSKFFHSHFSICLPEANNVIIWLKVLRRSVKRNYDFIRKAGENNRKYKVSFVVIRLLIFVGGSITTKNSENVFIFFNQVELQKTNYFYGILWTVIYSYLFWR